MENKGQPKCSGKSIIDQNTSVSYKNSFHN